MLDLHPRIITLGTAGGPRWWPAVPGQAPRQGIATAVVVGDALYLVDCGRGAGSQYARAGLALDRLRGVFLTHLHSDHTVDLPALLLFGWMTSDRRQGRPVRIIGPGDRGALPPTNANAASAVLALFPDTPTAGTTKMIEHLLRAYSADTADRMFDSLRPSPYTVFSTEDVSLPEGIGYDPNTNPSPAGMAPFEVYRDELVTVTATLVQHPPVAPAFAFRFDTAEGSVTISGDTAPCQNLITLATGTDLLLHEAIDFDWAANAYAEADEATRAATLEHHRKSHTSPAQAGALAREAGVQTLALHHLVPGDGLATAFEAAQDTFGGSVLIPDDLDVISFARRAEPALTGANVDNH
ncbi:MBL fold metallo-hydrolase [Crystallibacter degradans]|uniref:MBL fold metallo-hydrolase n=1 Tax=Crystallibacter degradans TaxID=2726743 RepID=UPI001F0CE699|nr:MBL fold metallo-hydrolase [Arthrobacter sp. SF27]